MRYTGSGVGNTATPGVLTVAPNAGANWQINTPRFSANTSTALETFLAFINAQQSYGASIVGTAGAGNKAVAELNNPNGSARALYVYSIDVFVPVAMAIQVVINGTTLAPATAPPNLFSGGAAGVAVVGGGNQLTPTGSVIYTTPTLTANMDYQIPLPYVCAIAANNNMQLIGQTVNQAFTCNIRWYQTNG